MDINDLKGVIPPIVTPIDEDENIDEQGLIRVIDHVLAGGVHGIFVMGSNGEFYAMDEENQRKAIEITVRHVNGRVPVYAGVGEITTKACIRLVKQAEEAGADAVTLLTPMFIKLSDQELYDHFREIAESTKLPVLLYNNPGKTANNISVKLVRRLAQIDNIIGIKNTSLDFAQTIKFIDATKDIENFKVLAGSDYYIYATLAYGGAGCVAGTANVAPALVSDIYEKFASGDLEGSLKAQYDLIPLRDTYDYGSFPVVMKDCLNLMGLNIGHPVKPIQHCTEDKMDEIKEILLNLGLIS
ncbi:dihydrodipicolinate synthase family protein [Proteiniclasticum ruminis]|uniref:4-hydroxy-tetrahydrodipicolinate synthase n=1 Tax=Proteiniclasticum ruminis TaxID=398199 RepID=A0A1G8HMR7_9CLOT|nr:dihydrodipicolinate synthase family protein [Proteiniclasticum ruminis]SDI07914.1 4-hydroxy-tetrahydrodipicolinate synthase [Proteiniclasticum ruminis]